MRAHDVNIVGKGLSEIKIPLQLPPCASTAPVHQVEKVRVHGRLAMTIDPRFYPWPRTNRTIVPIK